MKDSKKWQGAKKVNNSGTSSAYLLGFIGAAVYYLNIAHNFWAVVVSFLKAMVWPAFLVYHLLGLK